MVTKDAWDRYLQIDKKLRHGRKHTVKQIIIAIENTLGPITDKQVRNDFERMSKVYGAKIIHDNQHYYTYQDQNFTISKFPITEEDADVLHLVSMTLQPFSTTSIRKKYNSVVDKIFKGIDTTQKIANSNQREEFNFIQPEVSYGYTGYQWIESIFKAILNKTPIEIIYQKFGEEPSKKVLSPYILKEFRNHWYLIGYDHLKTKLTKVYALERINEVNLASETYFADPHFDAKGFFKYSFGIFHNYNDKPIKIKLEFYNSFAQQIINHPLMPTQKYKIGKAGKILHVELELYYSYEIVRELLSYGSSVKVISPKSLADEIKEKANKISSIY